MIQENRENPLKPLAAKHVDAVVKPPEGTFHTT